MHKVKRLVVARDWRKKDEQVSAEDWRGSKTVPCDRGPQSSCLESGSTGSNRQEDSHRSVMPIVNYSCERFRSWVPYANLMSDELSCN